MEEALEDLRMALRDAGVWDGRVEAAFAKVRAAAGELADALHTEHWSRESILGRGHRVPCQTCSLIQDGLESARRNP